MRFSDETLIEMYRRMLRIRFFDEAAGTQLEQGAIVGPVHASTGQEAAVVGACMALDAADYMAGNHRSHGHPIAKGAALGPLMAELMGRRAGVCRGKGGSMHLADFSVGSIGESGIVGGGIPLATGAGLSAQVRGSGQVAVSFFGDGASNQGTFHESLNLAAIWKLPVIFFCENNLYAATTPAASVTSVENIADRAAAYGIPGVVVDGQDVVAVWEATSTAVRRARDGMGPTLIEAKTYRYVEHAEAFPIPGHYRTQEEIESWRQRDPIQLHRNRLLSAGILSEAAAAELEGAIRNELKQAVDFGLNSELPEPSDAFAGVYASPVPAATRKATVAAAPNTNRSLSYFEAIFEGLRAEMRRDPGVLLLGEDIALYTDTPLLSGWGDRLRSCPISENGFVGMAVGAAMTGLRPVVDLTIASFFYLTMDQLVNQAAKIHYMFGGQTRVPLVVRAALWHNGSTAAHHSDRPYPMFMGVPGLKVVVPATPYDMKGLLIAAIRDDDPVLVFEDNDLWFQSGPVPEEDYIVPLGVADVRRRGDDVTVVAIGATVHVALEAASELAQDGISAEVIDPRSLVPLDKRTILASVEKTGRLVIVDLANKTAGAAAEIAAIVAEEGFGSLKAPISRVATPDVPIPFSPVMEKPLYPDKDKVASAVRRILER